LEEMGAKCKSCATRWDLEPRGEKTYVKRNWDEKVQQRSKKKVNRGAKESRGRRGDVNLSARVVLLGTKWSQNRGEHSRNQRSTYFGRIKYILNRGAIVW